MDAFLSFIPSRTFAQNGIPLENISLPEVSRNEAEKSLVAKIKNKMLLPTIRVL